MALGNAVLSTVMPVAGVAEAVTVAGDAPLDSRTIQTGATFGQKELESIPTTGTPGPSCGRFPEFWLPT